MFGVGEEVNVDNNLRIHRIPRGNVCIKVGTLHPALQVGSAQRARWQRGLVSKGRDSCVGARVLHTLSPPLETMKSFLRKFMSFFR